MAIHLIISPSRAVTRLMCCLSGSSGDLQIHSNLLHFNVNLVKLFCSNFGNECKLQYCTNCKTVLHLINFDESKTKETIFL